MARNANGTDVNEIVEEATKIRFKSTEGPKTWSAKLPTGDPLDVLLDGKARRVVASHLGLDPARLSWKMGADGVYVYSIQAQTKAVATWYTANLIQFLVIGE